MQSKDNQINSIGLLPNFEKEEFALCKELIHLDDSNKSKNDLKEFENKLKILFLKNHKFDADIYFFDSARSAFFVALKVIKKIIKEIGSIETYQQNRLQSFEVILPGFTCVVVVNPVLWNQMTPKFVDISYKDFNCTIHNIIKAVNKNTKVILVQHTFGALINVQKLRNKLKEIQRQDIIIIEDLAHVLGAADVGKYSDMSIVTFGYEKSISTIRGGALVINKSIKNKRIYKKFVKNLQKEYEKLEVFNKSMEKKLLLNTILWDFFIPKYYWGVGKFTLGRLFTFIGHKLGFLGLAIEKKEFWGDQPKFLPAKFPPKLAKLGVIQISKLQKLNNHRRNLAKKYLQVISKTKYKENKEQEYIKEVLENDKTHTFLRYPLLLESKFERDKLYLLAKKNRIVLGDWYKTMFYTKEKFYHKIGYKKDTCKAAEDIKDKIINLPTSIHTNIKHVKIIEKLLNQISRN